jgi:acetyltransferase-like isoleucine patch superfamily enzyme
MRLSALKKMDFVEVGKNCYLAPTVTITPFGGFGDDYSNSNNKILLKIGDGVGIAPNVTFLCSTRPNNPDLLSRYTNINPIVIEDDAWICTGSIIMPGITIHKSSIVAAGAVVTKDVPEGTMVAGVPAKPVKKVIDIELT